MVAQHWGTIAIGVLAVCLVTRLLTFKKLPAPLPPGPPPKPIIGNLKDLPPNGERDWEHWLKHKQLYGPISSITVLGQTFVILNDAKLAVELFEKRSKWHSDRPQMFFATEMAGIGGILGMIRYSDRSRAIQKAMSKEIGSKVAVSRFHGLQEAETRRFLLRVLEAPDDLRDHIRKEAGAVVLKLAYGYTVEPHKADPLVELADVSMCYFSSVCRYGAWLVDVIPSLRYLPSWFPGTEFKRVGQKSKEAFDNFGGKPYNFVKQQMSQGTHHPSYLSSILESEDIEPGSEKEYVTKWSAASIYAGGADTTVSTMACFFLAMALYPEAQRKGQEEIDRVIGNRLPTFADRDNLPYIDAMVKEVLRWHPVVPTNLAHVSTHDDMCQGYFIPKGSIILANLWGFTHDPDVFHDPREFKPERYLGDNPEPDPHRLAFGFGRRICPGRVMADAAIYLNIAQCLAAFNIGKKVVDGKEVEPRVEFQAALISHPEPYDVSIKPRSSMHEELIRAVEIDYPWEKSHADELVNIKA
ncbi:putative cytochrome P450 [Aspergillus nomiae NRRL 13137]|uniref:Putative cytochrome P450 n=1 Tax=Aspergillus nomiae NRRL (strain ATCC 15546 / NRRL 13137 / CBS 260.88 / M93) TaxID=1509407 RepID=A0A0L1INY8_ASPN3|nr:putative cytochrome P450 [Aspergillus nomiae NRRL 13137]KNG81214.1 putative cytochrome P450 [Aspergillus nomiae NRRL 13137]